MSTVNDIINYVLQEVEKEIYSSFYSLLKSLLSILTPGQFQFSLNHYKRFTSQDSCHFSGSGPLEWLSFLKPLISAPARQPWDLSNCSKPPSSSRKRLRVMSYILGNSCESQNKTQIKISLKSHVNQPCRYRRQIPIFYKQIGMCLLGGQQDN